MTLSKFSDEYRKELNRLPDCRLQAENVGDELHHRRMTERHKVRLARRGCAAVVFLLCGAGTAAAKNHYDSVIEVRDNGFVITDSGEARKSKNWDFYKMGGGAFRG